MGSVNHMTVLGNLGADPELKYTPTGKAVCNLRVATTDRDKQVEWHRVVVWEKDAENCSKFLRKGRPVYVEGRLKTRSWDKDGQKHYSTDIVAERVVFIGGADRPANEIRAGRTERVEAGPEFTRHIEKHATHDPGLAQREAGADDDDIWT